MRKPVQERDGIDAGDRHARGELSGRHHFERGAAMRRLEIGQRLGVALETRDDGAGLGCILRRRARCASRQFVIRRVARSGGARETGRGRPPPHASIARISPRRRALRRRRSRGPFSPSRRRLRQAGSRGRAHAPCWCTRRGLPPKAAGRLCDRKSPACRNAVRRLRQASRRRWPGGPSRLRRRPSSAFAVARQSVSSARSTVRRTASTATVGARSAAGSRYFVNVEPRSGRSRSIRRVNGPISGRRTATPTTL